MASAGPPPPPEVLAAQRAVDYEDLERQKGLVVTSVVLTVVATIFVGMRCVSRFYMIKNAGVDDYLMIGAWVFVVGYLANVFMLQSFNVGFPMTMISFDDMIGILKVTLAIEVMYYTNLMLIKTSILCTYLRFAVSHRFRQLCYGTIILHGVFFIICVIVTLAQCKPLAKMYDLTGTVEGYCVNTTIFFYTTSAFNIVTDIWILALPIRTLSKIMRPRHEKIALFFVFGVGAFACVASIVRLHTIYRYTLAVDPFKDALVVNIWSMIELTIAVSCASVSAIKPIFSRKTRYAISSGGASGPSGKSSGSGSAWSGSKNTRSTGSRPTSRRDVEMGIGHAAVPHPPTAALPPLRPKVSSGLSSDDDMGLPRGIGLDPMESQSPASSAESSSMIVFTPLSPRVKSPDKEKKHDPMQTWMESPGADSDPMEAWKEKEQEQEPHAK